MTGLHPKHVTTSIDYLPHVDGLRAVSVLLVMLFHAWPESLPGGFVGVDVFFVISGFLITRLLLAQMANEMFSVIGFLIRRVRRLWPSFALVAIVSLLMGWIVLDAGSFVDLANALTSSVFLVSNWYFYAETDYFNEALNNNFLLHTWSLAVEEQFYLIYPLVLLALSRSRTMLWIGLALVWGLSFAASVYAAEFGGHQGSFFAAHLRVWELASGAIACLVWRDGRMQAATPLLSGGGTLIGLGLIVTSAALVSGGPDFPGWVAAMPVAGALLCILYGASAPSPVAAILKARWMVSIGLVSYALYLWHWPILKGLQAFDPSPSDAALVLALGVSFGLAALTWRYVETPVRHGSVLSTTPKLLAGFLGGSIILLLASQLVRHNRGFPTRLPNDLAVILSVGADERTTSQICGPAAKIAEDVWGLSLFETDHSNIFTLCILGDLSLGKPDSLYWGDSHLGSVTSALAAEFANRGRVAVTASKAACPPLYGVAWSGLSAEEAKDCALFNQQMRTLIAQAGIPKTVLISHWDTYADPDVTDNSRSGLQSAGATPVSDADMLLTGALGDTLPDIAGLTELHVLLDVPTHDVRVPQALVFQKRWPWLRSDPWITKQEQERRRSAYAAIMSEYAVAGRLTLHDPIDAFCPDEICLAERDGRPLFFDASHLTRVGAEYLLETHPGLLDPAVEPDEE